VAVAARFLVLLMALSLSACFSTSVHKTAARTASTSQNKLQIYYVRANDTLYSIGRRFGTDYLAIARRNHLHAPYAIYVGQQLYINRTAPGDAHLSVSRTISRAATSAPVPPRGSVVKKKSVKRATATAPKRRSSHPRAVANTTLLWPVKGTLTSRFGHRGSRMHDGIDIGAPDGTAVHAAASGEVVYSDSRLSGYGKLIIIRHGKNLFTAYAHNQRNLVRKGEKVRAGDVIARVGHTGRASGPHLHFEVRQGSTPVDPLAYLPR